MVNLEFKSRGGSMYRLRILKNGSYQFHVNGGRAFEGAPDAIIAVAKDLGVEGSELAIAKQELEWNGHDYADFGVMGRFMYTGKDRRKEAA